MTEPTPELTAEQQRCQRARALPFGDAANLAWALVCFSRRVRGKFGDREKALICIALQQRLHPLVCTTADLREWITFGLPEAWLFYERELADYATRLTPRETFLARQTAWSMARGSGRRFVPDEVAMAIEKHFPREQVGAHIP